MKDKFIWLFYLIEIEMAKNVVWEIIFWSGRIKCHRLSSGNSPHNDMAYEMAIHLTVLIFIHLRNKNIVYVAFKSFPDFTSTYDEEGLEIDQSFGQTFFEIQFELN